MQYKKNHRIVEGMDMSHEANQKRYQKLVDKNTRASRKGLAIMDNVVDRTNQISANALMIGTSEFQTLDLSRDIAKAKAENLPGTYGGLQNISKKLYDFAKSYKSEP